MLPGLCVVEFHGSNGIKQLHPLFDSHQSFLLRCDILSEFLITLVRKMCFNKRDILENPIPGESVRSFSSLLRRLIQRWEKQLAENRICFTNHFSSHYYNSLGKRWFFKISLEIDTRVNKFEKLMKPVKIGTLCPIKKICSSFLHLLQSRRKATWKEDMMFNHFLNRWKRT